MGATDDNSSCPCAKDVAEHVARSIANANDKSERRMVNMGWMHLVSLLFILFLAWLCGVLCNVFLSEHLKVSVKMDDMQQAIKQQQEAVQKLLAIAAPASAKPSKADVPIWGAPRSSARCNFGWNHNEFPHDLTRYGSELSFSKGGSTDLLVTGEYITPIGCAWALAFSEEGRLVLWTRKTAYHPYVRQWSSAAFDSSGHERQLSGNLLKCALRITTKVMTERVTFVELNICCQENGVFSDQAVCKPVPVRLANRYPVPIGERVQIDPSAERIEDAFSV